MRDNRAKEKAERCPMSQKIPEKLPNFLRDAGFGEIRAIEKINAGHMNQSFRLRTANEQSLILKQNFEAQPRLFEYEADGLKVLADAGMRSPKVLTFGDEFLLLEDLGDYPKGDWEEFGRAVALLHRHTNEKFGFHYDNYLGSLPQINTWMDDGHAFFGQNRVLRYLSEERCAAVLSTQDRRDLERFVQRLPDLVPKQPASLLHGDLWHTNMLFDSEGKAAVIDPAVYYGWAEAELSQTRQYGVVPQVFYDAYNEVNPLENGWWERLELLTIRQCMAVLAFFGNQYNTLEELRGVMAKFL
jgi:fructosamine-3-kinase